jgi:hypothetical protein
MPSFIPKTISRMRSPEGRCPVSGEKGLEEELFASIRNMIPEEFHGNQKIGERFRKGEKEA